MIIAVFSAFPQELRHVRRNVAVSRSWKEADFTFSLGSLYSVEMLLIETGLGAGRPESALDRVLKEYHPDILLSIGFGGALYEGARPGDLVWGSKIIFLPEEDPESSAVPQEQAFLLIPDDMDLLGGLRSGIPVQSGCVVTIERRTDKAEIRQKLPPGVPFPVCDMETYGLARMCEERKVPFFSIRSVSDTLDEEIPATLFNVTDKSGNYSLAKTLGTIMENPDLVPDIVRLGRNSYKASRALWQAVEILTGILKEKIV